MSYVIRYRYPGSVSHGDGPMLPVGLVFVRKSSIGRDNYSYSLGPQEATHYRTREEAEAVAHGKRWPEAEVMPLAPPAPDRARPQRGRKPSE